MNQINFLSFPELKTEHCTLRQLTNEDEKEIFALRSDEKVNKYLDRPPAKTLDDARQFIQRINNSIAENIVIYWAITPHNNNKLFGTICFWNFSEDFYTAEIGFELLPEFQGKGIMQEVLTSVIEFGFGNLNLKSIEGEVDPNNLRSIKILERNNFARTTKGNSVEKDNSKTVMYQLSQ